MKTNENGAVGKCLVRGVRSRSRFCERQQSPFDSNEEEGKEKEKRELLDGFLQRRQKKNITHEKEWNFIKGVNLWAPRLKLGLCPGTLTLEPRMEDFKRTKLTQN